MASDSWGEILRSPRRSAIQVSAWTPGKVSVMVVTRPPAPRLPRGGGRRGKSGRKHHANRVVSDHASPTRPSAERRIMATDFIAFLPQTCEFLSSCVECAVLGCGGRVQRVRQAGPQNLLIAPAI